MAGVKVIVSARILKALRSWLFVAVSVVVFGGWSSDGIFGPGKLGNRSSLQDDEGLRGFAETWAQTRN